MDCQITDGDNVYDLIFWYDSYSGGKPMIEAYRVETHDGVEEVVDLWDTVTANPMYLLEAGEAVVRTHNEHAWTLDLLTLLPEVFKDTGKRIPASFAELQIWTFSPNKAMIDRRLQYLREQIQAENISYGELFELQSLVAHIDPDGVELLEWAGKQEFEEHKCKDCELIWSDRDHRDGRPCPQCKCKRTIVIP